MISASTRLREWTYLGGLAGFWNCTITGFALLYFNVFFDMISLFRNEGHPYFASQWWSTTENIARCRQGVITHVRNTFFPQLAARPLEIVNVSVKASTIKSKIKVSETVWRHFYCMKELEHNERGRSVCTRPWLTKKGRARMIRFHSRGTLT